LEIEIWNLFGNWKLYLGNLNLDTFILS